MSFAGQIEYNSIIINFVRQWNNFAIRKAQNQAISRSAAGIRETLNFANQDIIQAVKERLTAQELAELLQFYEFAKDGSSFIFTRDRGLGAYWNFEKTLNNNDENPLTFTRTAGTAGNASYTDPSTGLLKFEDTLNTPRYGSGKYGHGLVIEGARTNLCQESTDFTGAGWSDINIATTDDTTEVLDPAGGNNAAKCLTTAGNATITYLTGTASNTLDITNSIYIRCASGTVNGDIKVVDSVDGIEATTDFIATPEWQRVQVTKENSTGAGNIALRVQIDPNATVLYLYGAQIEAAANALFASNYISTDGATKTRNAETPSIATANIFNPVKCTIMFWMKPEWVFNKQAASILFDVVDAGDDRIFATEVNAAGLLQTRVFQGDEATSIFLSTSMSGILTQDTWAHIAITYDSLTANSLKQYVNGVLVGTDTHDPFAVKTDHSKIYVGNSGGAFQSFATFDEPLIRKDVLPGSMIAQIAAQGVGLGEIRNRWPAVALSNPDFLEEQLKGINRYNYRIDMEEILS